MNVKNFLVLCFVLLLVACATVGKEISLEQIDAIQEGVTTKGEVLEILGTPTSVSMGYEGKEMLMYVYSKASNAAQNFIPFVGLVQSKIKTGSQIVQVWIGTDGIVEKRLVSTSQSDIKSGLITE